jgi:hypothetical protein
MAITFRKNASRETLYALAVENGIEIAEDADRAAIIEALEAYDAQTNEETPAEGAENAAEGNDDGGGDNDPGNEEKPTEGAENAAEGNDGGGDNDPGDAEKPAEGAQDGAGTAGAGTTDTTQPKTPAEGAEDDAEGYDRFVYVGPTIPGGLLKENAVFRGTFPDIKAYLKDVLARYPQAARLIVPTTRLAEYAAKVKTPGNLAHKYYQDIVSTVKKHKEV